MFEIPMVIKYLKFQKNGNFRPKNLSNDVASSDSAVMHAFYINKILKYNFDIFSSTNTALRKLELDLQ